METNHELDELLAGYSKLQQVDMPETVDLKIRARLAQIRPLPVPVSYNQLRWAAAAAIVLFSLNLLAGFAGSKQKNQANDKYEIGFSSDDSFNF